MPLKCCWNLKRQSLACLSLQATCVYSIRLLPEQGNPQSSARANAADSLNAYSRDPFPTSRRISDPYLYTPPSLSPRPPLGDMLRVSLRLACENLGALLSSSSSDLVRLEGGRKYGLFSWGQLETLHCQLSVAEKLLHPGQDRCFRSEIQGCRPPSLGCAGSDPFGASGRAKTGAQGVGPLRVSSFLTDPAPLLASGYIYANMLYLLLQMFSRVYHERPKPSRFFLCSVRPPSVSKLIWNRAGSALNKMPKTCKFILYQSLC